MNRTVAPTSNSIGPGQEQMILKFQRLIEYGKVKLIYIYIIVIIISFTLS